ncbi:PAS domain S-box protein [Chlorogloeopsis sp. ULAP01]|uniref:PAS domain S-box protein n=1 Tax=Chlorogloeopsis sp. ULAP01 TaxID=3056483 RepID=UPI0025AA77AE|nr:PAS domain S-box protein [Chlorogloeopsis sp. ULAP01]MDM9384807.1 PAS domain S-box protein [Chlorogloeopsis sp. ULAP01]
MLRNRWIVFLLALLTLFLAHGLALFYRVQPAVSLWFPPSGVAIALTLWFGPIGAILAGIASIVMAPFWGNQGWHRLVGLTDVIEPLVAWFVYCYCFRGSLTLQGLRSTIKFIVSVPLAACATSAIVGTSTLFALGKLPAANLSVTIAHWWLGNAIATMAITPPMLLLFTPVLRQWRLISVTEQPQASQPKLIAAHWWRDRPSEIFLILIFSISIAWLAVEAAQGTNFIFEQFSLLSFIPIVWAAIRFGVTGGILTASFCVLLTLFYYLLLYPNLISLPISPTEAKIFYIHNFHLLIQCAVGLVVGAAILERDNSLVAPTAEAPSQFQLNKKLFQLNFLLTKIIQQLQESEECFRTSVENMLDCFGIYCAIRDESGRITDFRVEYVNDAACINNLMTREEQIGRGLCEILPGHRDCGLFDEYCQVVETGQPLIKDELIYEDKFRHQRLVRAFDIRIAKFGDGFVATWRDITDRRQAEIELSRREQELATLLENSPDIIMRLDRELRYIYVNSVHEKATGLKSEDLLGKTVAEVWQNQEQHQQWQTNLQAAFQTGKTQIDEFSFPDPNGTVHFYQTQIVPEFITDGSVTSVLTVTREITKLKETETALRQSEAQFRRIVDSNIIGIFFGDISGNITAANDAFLAMIGYNQQDLLAGRIRWDTLTPPEHLERSQKAVEELQATGTCTPFEKEFFRKDGSRVWVEIGGALFDSDREGLCYVLDITARKQSQEALRESQERLNLALEAANMGSWDWNIQTGEVYWSPNLERLFGLEPGSFDCRYETVMAMIHPGDRQWVLQAIYRALDEQQEYNIEFRFVKPDGKIRWAVGRGQVFYDAIGNAVRMTGVDLDITDRKQAEEALRQSELMFRTLADTMPQMFWITQPDGYHEYFNQRWYDYTQTSLEETQGNGWQNILHPDDVQGTIEVWHNSLRTGDKYNIEYRLRCGNDGEYRWHLGRALPLRNQDGQIVKWFGSCTDIHDQKLAIEERAQALERERAARIELERASRMKDEFLAIVSHELRSPLNGILGWSRLLRTRRLAADKTEQALASIERNAQAQTQLIEDLLDISRIIRGQIRLDLQPTSLMTAIQAALDTVSPTANTKSIQIESRLNPNVGLVSGDLDRLQQIVWNLLSNAVKFTSEGGRVEIRLEQVGSCAQIQVIDTGRGISSDFLPYVFVRFRQADATTTRTQGGLGLGLAIVRNLVELHNGTVSVASKGKGQGATFTVQLPLLGTDSAPSQQELSIQRQTDTQASFNLQGLKILAVDDQADAREFLTAALSEYGANVTTAASTREALQILELVKPDVLLSDIGMPGEDGYALIRQIRQLPLEQGGQIPAAALTAYAREGDRLQALAAGFQMHIPKPIEPIQLLTVVAKLAGNRVGGIEN